MQNLQSKLLFIQEIDKLKEVIRRTLIYSGQRLENSGEHSWHLAMAVLIFKDEANEKALDLLKALKMALIHDLVEIDSGDTFLYGDTSQKHTQESLAAERLFGLLPQNLGAELKNIWQEFEKRETPEAQFVAALDRFLPLLSNCLNKGHSWQEHHVSYEQVLEKAEKTISQGSTKLWNLTEKLLEEAKSKGHLHNKKS